MPVKKWNLVLGLSVLFLSGVLIGVLGTAIYFKQNVGHFFGEGQPAVTKMVMKKLDRELDLTAAQRSEIEKIVAEVQTDLWKFRTEHRPEIEGILTRGIALMKPLLSPEQQRKLDELSEKMKERWRRPGGPSHGRPGMRGQDLQ
jgi:Spy/CpxP family protein refolding chaperone